LIAFPPEPNVYYIIEIAGNNIVVSTERQGSAVTLTSAIGSVSTVIKSFSTIVTVPTDDVSGLFEVGQYIIDSTGLLPAVAYITNIVTNTTDTIITVGWDNYQTIAGTSVASVVTADTPLSNYALFDGARIVFAADTNIDPLEIKFIFHVSHLLLLTSTPVITLTEAPQR
jgi:hypothetical protein